MSVPNITVLDSIMGSGKTSYIIDKMNADGGANRFLYIAPLLSEVERIKDACPSLDFQDPKPIGGRKLNHLQQLVADGQNIASTHQLFLMLDAQTRKQLDQANYILVIDEETECVKEHQVSRDDIQTLLQANCVYVDGQERLCWNDADWPAYRGQFDDIKTLCDNGSLVMVRNEFLVWEFPIEFLALFKEVHILTYLFEGSLLSSYLKANGVPYTQKTLDSSRRLVNPDPAHEAKTKSRLRKLINIIDDRKLNAVGTPRRQENPLSANWFRKDLRNGGAMTTQLKKNTYNYFRHRTKGQGTTKMWSCLKPYKHKLKGKGYTQGWTACNLKATNDHIEKKHLAYLLNVFHRPRLVQYFHDCGVTTDQDKFALSQLIQWIFRSGIRRGDSVDLYLPSARMRELLLDWLT